MTRKFLAPALATLRKALNKLELEGFDAGEGAKRLKRELRYMANPDRYISELVAEHSSTNREDVYKEIEKRLEMMYEQRT